jgi:phosphohistidine swiveling domain-containing protein
MAKTEQWFKWEREATINSIYFPTLGGMEPMKEYCGYRWPLTLLIYKGDILLWCNKMKDLHDLGEKLIKIYLAPAKLAQLKHDLETRTTALEKVFQKIDKTKVSLLSNEGLMQLYAEFSSVYIDWWAVGFLVEPVSLKGEVIIRKMLSQNKEFNKNFSLLTSIPRKSFSKRQEEDLLKILIFIKSKPRYKLIFEQPLNRAKKTIANFKELEELLLDHAERYSWLHNNYFKTEVLTVDYFIEELFKLNKKYDDAKKYLKQLLSFEMVTAEKKKELIKTLALSPKQKNIISLIEFFGWFQDYRKEITMQADHYVEVFLREVFNRSDLTFNECKWLFPSELKLVLQGKISKQEIKQRMKNCMLVWKPNKKNHAFFVGKQALKKEKQFFLPETVAQEIIELSGNIANQGRVKAKAFVTMNPADADKMEEGEILVTSMTSPDFIAAMKKASAIVTNEGGITCHAAIVSRELGIPCIVGTGKATKSIKTGDYLEVDANHGFVRKLVKK